jgi:hypothetical protein
MDLDHAGLDHVDEARKVVDHQHRFLLADLDATDAVVQASPGMLGEETFLASARRAAQQAQRPAGDVWKDPVGELRVEVRQALFGDARLRPQDALRVREPDL